MRRSLTALLVLALLGVPLAAQARKDSPPWVKYGKWVLLGATIGMNLAASETHNRADESYQDLEDRCFQSPSLCQVDGSGSYLDPTSEALYQRSVRLDRTTKAWLIGAQTALLGAATMFIWEFTRPPGEPDDNVPFAPRVQPLTGTVGLGMELRF